MIIINNAVLISRIHSIHPRPIFFNDHPCMVYQVSGYHDRSFDLVTFTSEGYFDQAYDIEIVDAKREGAPTIYERFNGHIRITGMNRSQYETPIVRCRLTKYLEVKGNRGIIIDHDAL